MLETKYRHLYPVYLMENFKQKLIFLNNFYQKLQSWDTVNSRRLHEKQSDIIRPTLIFIGDKLS